MRQFRMLVAMWCLAISVPLAGILVVAIPWAGFAAPGAGGDPITATPNPQLSAKDLAWALGVKWWSYHLRFDKPVKGISIRPCELRRQPDGTWKREYLAIGHGKFGTDGFREVDIAFLIPETPERKTFAFKVGDQFAAKGSFRKPPDFEESITVPTVARMIDGCLILVYYPEKDPTVFTGKEENMLRLFGLSIETEE